MRYEDLTDAQKKWIMHNSIINAAYLVERLSTLTGGQDGQALRREGFMATTDTFKTYTPANKHTELASLYDNPLWAKVLDASPSFILGYPTNDNQPIVHFMKDLRENKGMTDLDMEYVV
jgi:hypothetical protein